MPRKKLVCPLPAPRRSRGNRRILDDRQLLEILRRLALTHQRAEPQLFYPLRDAARELGVSLSAISRAYETLKKEGILGTIRASCTVIEGHQATSQISFKGFIGLPLSLSCFATLQDYRSFYFALRRESQRRGFVSNLLFYSDNDRGHDELSAMLTEFGVHHVIWYLPRRSVEPIILRLNDRGIRVICIGDGGAVPVFCKYEIRREPALVAILRKWRTDNQVRHVTIVRTKPYAAADEEMVEHAVEKSGLASDSRELRAEHVAEVISSLGKDARHGVVLLGKPASIASIRAPAQFSELLGRCRVALVDGPTTSVHAAIHGRVDVVTIDWHLVAKTIVRDIATKRAFEQTNPAVFLAVPRFRAAVAENAAL